MISQKRIWICLSISSLITVGCISFAMSFYLSFVDFSNPNTMNQVFGLGPTVEDYASTYEMETGIYSSPTKNLLDLESILGTPDVNHAATFEAGQKHPTTTKNKPTIQKTIRLPISSSTQKQISSSVSITKTSKPSNSPSPQKQKNSPVPTEKVEPAYLSCDAMDYITIVSGNLINDENGCLYEAVIRNSHSNKTVWVITHHTVSSEADFYTHSFPPESELGYPFSLSAGTRRFSSDWFVAIFDTQDCKDFFRSKKIEQYPAYGMETKKISAPSCGK